MPKSAALSAAGDASADPCSAALFGDDAFGDDEVLPHADLLIGNDPPLMKLLLCSEKEPLLLAVDVIPPLNVTLCLLNEGLLPPAAADVLGDDLLADDSSSAALSPISTPS